MGLILRRVSLPTVHIMYYNLENIRSRIRTQHSSAQSTQRQRNQANNFLNLIFIARIQWRSKRNGWWLPTYQRVTKNTYYLIHAHYLHTRERQKEPMRRTKRNIWWVHISSFCRFSVTSLVEAKTPAQNGHTLSCLALFQINFFYDLHRTTASTKCNFIACRRNKISSRKNR